MIDLKQNKKHKTRKDKPRDKLMKRKEYELRKLLKEMRKESKNDNRKNTITVFK